MSLLGGSHWCDYDKQHPHEGCECPCPMCFSFWHANVFRYEDEKRAAGRVSRDG